MASEKKRAEVAKEAKQILDKFSEALKSVKLKEKELKSKVGGFRKEGAGERCDGDFRMRMFEFPFFVKTLKNAIKFFGPEIHFQ